MEDLFSDIILSVLNAANTAVQNRQLSTLELQVSAIDAEIDSLDAQIADWRSSGNDTIADNLQLQRNTLNEFRIIYNIFAQYLRDTNGGATKQYSDWIEEFNNILGGTPADLISNRNPNWYNYIDTDNDGSIDSSNNLGNWSSASTNSALIYRRLRSLVSVGRQQTVQQSILVPAVPQMNGGQGGAGGVSSSSLTGNLSTGSTSGVGGLTFQPECYFYFDVQERSVPGNQSLGNKIQVKVKGKDYLIEPPCELWLNVYRCCNTNIAPYITANQRYSVTGGWKKLTTAEVAYKVEKCSNGNDKLIYKYYYDVPGMVEQVNSILRFSQIPVLENGNVVNRNLLDHINDRIEAESGYNSKVGKKATLVKDINSICPTFGQEPPANIIQPGAVGFTLNGLLQERGPNGFYTTSETILLTNTNGNWLGKLEAIIVGAYNQQTQEKKYIKGAADLITNISAFNGFETTNYPFDISKLPQGRFIAAVEAGCGGQTGCGNVDFNGNFVADCELPYQNFVNPNTGETFPSFNWLMGLRDGVDWQDIADDLNPFDQQSQTFLNLTSTVNTTSNGEVIEVVGAAKFNRNSPNFVTRNIGPINVNRVPLDNAPCFTGTETVFKTFLKRRKKIFFDVLCAGKRISYIAKDLVTTKNINNGDKLEYPANASEQERAELRGPYALDLILRSIQFGGITSRSNIQLETNPNSPNYGQFYYWNLVEAPYIDNFGVGQITSLDSIQLDEERIGCATESQEEEWIVDPTNPCGCIEIQILTHYLNYPSITYKNPVTGKVTEIPATKKLNKKFYPVPNPNPYGIAEGQSVGETRPKEDCENRPVRIHHPFLFGADVLTGVKTDLIRGLFNTSQSLDCYLTSSTQPTASKSYYYDITDCEGCGKKSYYAVAYGHQEGSGSLASGYDAADSPARAIYSQYRLLALEAPDKYFTFYNVPLIQEAQETSSLWNPKDIYVINFYRDGLSDKLDLGNFQINLAQLSGSHYANNVHTGSNVKVAGASAKILSLIDNSGDANQTSFCVEDPYSYYEIVSGSLSEGIYPAQTGSQYEVYGKVYPNLGVIVLNGARLNDYLNFNSVSGSNIAGDNAWKLHTSISGAAALGYPMKARNVRRKTTNHYFVRVPTTEANYTTNPTFVIDSGDKKGYLKYECFIQNPITYITSVGLYNEKKELLAVAKLSKPIQKSPQNDVLIKIRLSW